MENVMKRLEELRQFCYRYYATGGDQRFEKLISRLTEEIQRKDKQLERLTQLVDDAGLMYMLDSMEQVGDDVPHGEFE